VLFDWSFLERDRGIEEWRSCVLKEVDQFKELNRE
jgi:hypothetical protein